jgi:four helix bundle protein
MGRTQFENFRVYQLAEELSDVCWKIVGMWESFAQITVGRQLVTAADSVGANIAEGSGRKSFADNKRVATIARGSLYELKHWLRRAYN